MLCDVCFTMQIKSSENSSSEKLEVRRNMEKWRDEQIQLQNVSYYTSILTVTVTTAVVFFVVLSCISVKLDRVSTRRSAVSVSVCCRLSLSASEKVS